MTPEAESFHPQPTWTLASATVDIPGKLVTYTVVSRKRAHGRCTLLCAQTGGWVFFVTSLDFTT